MSELTQERLRGLGGTDSPVVLGVSPYKTRMELWLEKRGLLQEQEETPVMKRGKALEPLVAEMYREKTGRELFSIPMAVHPLHPFLVAHPDRLFALDGSSDQFGILEIKTMGLRAFSRAKREGLPLHHTLQLQHYMSFPKVAIGSFAVFNADLWELITFDVQPDKELQDNIIEADREFWSMVLAGQEPQDEAPAIDLPPAAPSEIVKVDSPEWGRAIAQLREAREILADAEAFWEEAKEGAIALMNGGEIVEGFGARLYHKLQPGRKSLDKTLMKRDGIDLGKYEKAGAPFRSFRPYWLRGGENE